MWQAPSLNAESSSYSSEAEEGNVSSTISDDTAENRILSSPAAALIICRIPVGMSSNIQSQRLRGHRRRTCGGSQRVRSFRMANCNTCIDTPTNHCNSQNFNQESVSRIRTQEESSYRVATKRNGGNQGGYLFEDQQDIEMDSALPNNPARGLLVSTDSAQTHPLEILSQSRLELRSSYSQTSSPVNQIDDNSNTMNERLLEPELELPLAPLIRADNACKDQFELSMKHSVPQNNSKSIIDFDDTISSPLPRKVPTLPKPTAHAQKLANSLIKLSRYLKTPNLTELCCLDCQYVPVLPVTGQCGHTRCMRCIVDNGVCPCSADAPKSLLVNTVVREIIEKMMRYIKLPRKIELGPARACGDKISLIGDGPRHSLKRRHIRPLRLSSLVNASHYFWRPRLPMTAQARYRRARHLLDAGKYLEAASHLARVAASAEPFARVARILLTQTISAVCGKRSPSPVPRQLRRAVSEQSARSWLRPSDLECVLCTGTYRNPVCTPCGHTYCRECIERSLYYKKTCALCLSSLENFNLAKTQDTVFISSILSSIDALPFPDETDVLPVVTCHVAYPGMPCPLFVFNPRYCLMVQRVLESGSRRFGMLAYTFANYGTVLEIRDCVVFEDSCCIVSTVGVSRFRVIERYEKDGCDVARIQSLTDMNLTAVEDLELPLLAVKVYSKASFWLHNMDLRIKSVREEIQTAFGSLPYDVKPEELGKTSDGPNWLWWLVAILPLNREIKFLILSTRSLLKRMLAVSRALDLVDSDLATLAASDELANQEVWLPRDS
ncbi:uncharacterized protein LOC112053469 [Bicyclus anynana]|uniref:Uncharacterized protein LOC112053469 n=1 Tax=Bicyclus anynana TaxID=110368 RepID=A0ABM3M556_BICAN|nr:uncharacterized protein LOC112053469 [Bicyclus anynana]